MQGFDPIAYINEPRWRQVRPGLERITELLDRMGRPQDRLRFVHVAGTNGKGSTCAYLASILQTAGYKTGLFTSPYIMQFEERIRIDGRNISYDDLRDVTLFVRGHAEAMAQGTGEHPTEFELMTAVAFEHFARQACDIVVAEVGLGGRLDSTNVIAAPEACVIARIGLDHTDLLGDTPADIAREKAGIVKPGAAVVSWPQDDEDAMRAVRNAAASSGCLLTVPDFTQLHVGKVPAGGAVRPFSYRGRRYETALLASYQPYNAALALETVQALRARGWNVPPAAVDEGVRQARWPGRFEVVSAAPPVIVDGGHNPQGAQVLADSLADVFPDRPVTFVMGVLADKDYGNMIRAVAPSARAFVCAAPPNPRALSAGDLARAVRAELPDPAMPVEAAGDYRRAMERARQLAGPDGIVCAFGSLYAVAEVKNALSDG